MMNLQLRLNIIIMIFLFVSDVSANETPDYIREKNIDDQITSYIFDAEISELDSLLEKKFNLVFNNNSSDTSILLLHGRGLHPTEPNVIDPLRIELSESNYNVFSLQLPVLAKGQTYYDYHKIFPYSDARIETAIKNINSSNIIIIAHSCGANMLLSFLENISLSGITGIVLLSAGAVDKDQIILNKVDLSLYKLPILNIYGELDHNSVKVFADNLEQVFTSTTKSSLQIIEVKNTDHNYSDSTAFLIQSVKKWLKSL